MKDMTCVESAPLVWLTGISSAGKSTLALELSRRIQAMNIGVQVLDADEIRPHLCKDLSFSPEDRDENVRRLAYLASLFVRHGIIVIAAAVSSFRDVREKVRASTNTFIEVHVDAPVLVCERRDPLGVYRRFRSGEISGLSGLDAPYEEPLHPEVGCLTANETVSESVDKIIFALMANGRPRRWRQWRVPSDPIV